MNKRTVLGISTALLLPMSLLAQAIQYPETRKDETVDTTFYVAVADPYRWLEDDKSKETADWVKAQNAVTEDYLNKITFRKKLKEKLAKVWNYEKFSTPIKRGENYYYTKNDGVQNQPVVCVRKGVDGKEKVIFDINKLSPDGTLALTGFEIASNGKFLIYKTAKSGSDWEEINILDVENEKPMPDIINWVKFSEIAVKGNGFYYSRYPEAPKGQELSGKNENHRVYFHTIGTPQSQDLIIYENPAQPQRTFTAQTTEDGKFLMIYESESTNGNAMYVKELLKKDAAWKTVVDDFSSEIRVVDNIGNSLIVVTNKKAPRYRCVIIDINKIEEDKWKPLIPEKDEEVLQNVVLAGEKMIGLYMKDAVSKMYVYSGTGKEEGTIELPGIGSVDGINGSKLSPTLLFSYSSFTVPPTIYRWEGKKPEVLMGPKLDIKTDKLETEQVFFTSKDGTKVPMFIVHKKGMEMDGASPALLHGYGGFNISKTPEFKIDRLLFLEEGGVFAMPCLRGGGEYGEDWHKAGMQLSKQNVFDDFIAAAEYLISERYTSSEFLAINGRSNGGLLIGACMTQRPELFRCAIPQVGVMDMLRYHKFTIGWAWANEYGSPEDSTQFYNLLTYSPLHNIKDGVNYPATLVTTGDHDDRVVPAHSFKFIATLQDKYKGEQPQLIRIDSNAGHGAGKPTSKQIEEQADILSFMMFNLGMDPKLK